MTRRHSEHVHLIAHRREALAESLGRPSDSLARDRDLTWTKKRSRKIRNIPPELLVDLLNKTELRQLHRIQSEPVRPVGYGMVELARLRLEAMGLIANYEGRLVVTPDGTDVIDCDEGSVDVVERMKICYHGTDPEAAKNIRKEGFRPGTYFSETLSGSIWFGVLKSEDEYRVMFEVAFPYEVSSRYGEQFTWLDWLLPDKIFRSWSLKTTDFYENPDPTLSKAIYGREI